MAITIGNVAMLLHERLSWHRRGVSSSPGDRTVKVSPSPVIRTIKSLFIWKIASRLFAAMPKTPAKTCGGIDVCFDLDHLYRDD